MNFLIMVGVGILILGAVVAIVFALLRVIKNTKTQSAAPENSITAKVTRAYSQENPNYSLDDSNAATIPNYYIEFVLPDKSKHTFKVSKKRFQSFAQGDTGNLVFKGSKLISFQKTSPPQSPRTHTPKAAGMAPYFFQNSSKNGLVLKFYAENPGMGVSIPASAAIDCDFDEVSAYINRMFGSNTDNFFGLEKPTGDILQVSNDGRETRCEIDIPLSGGYSYKGMLPSPGELRSCVNDFYKGTDIITKYRLTYEEQ